VRLASRSSKLTTNASAAQSPSAWPGSDCSLVPAARAASRLDATSVCLPLFRGRPPFAPFTRAASRLASVFARPPLAHSPGPPATSPLSPRSYPSHQAGPSSRAAWSSRWSTITKRNVSPHLPRSFGSPHLGYGRRAGLRLAPLPGKLISLTRRAVRNA
jgi:hypothetical protein